MKPHHCRHCRRRMCPAAVRATPSTLPCLLSGDTPENISFLAVFRQMVPAPCQSCCRDTSCRHRQTPSLAHSPAPDSRYLWAYAGNAPRRTFHGARMASRPGIRTSHRIRITPPHQKQKADLRFATQPGEHRHATTASTNARNHARQMRTLRESHEARTGMKGDDGACAPPPRTAEPSVHRVIAPTFPCLLSGDTLENISFAAVSNLVSHARDNLFACSHRRPIPTCEKPDEAPKPGVERDTCEQCPHSLSFPCIRDDSHVGIGCEHHPTASKPAPDVARAENGSSFPCRQCWQRTCAFLEPGMVEDTNYACRAPLTALTAFMSAWVPPPSGSHCRPSDRSPHAFGAAWREPMSAPFPEACPPGDTRLWSGSEAVGVGAWPMTAPDGSPRLAETRPPFPACFQVTH